MLKKQTMLMKVQVQEESEAEEKDQDEVVDVSSLFRQSVCSTYFHLGRTKLTQKKS